MHTVMCTRARTRTHTHIISTRGGQMLLKRMYKGVRLWKCLDHGCFCYLVLQLWLLFHSACQVLCKLWLFLQFVHRVLLHSLCSVVQDVIISAVCLYSVFINAALSTGCSAGHDCFCCLFWLLLRSICGVVQPMIVSAVCSDCCCILSVGYFAGHDCFCCSQDVLIVAVFRLQGVMKAALTGLYSVLERPQVLCGGGCWQTHLANYVRHEVSTWPLIYHEWPE